MRKQRTPEELLESRVIRAMKALEALGNTNGKFPIELVRALNSRLTREVTVTLRRLRVNDPPLFSIEQMMKDEKIDSPRILIEDGDSP